jgi:hypothetical protein
MDIVNDVMRGASETYDSLFGGDEQQNKNKKMIYAGIAIVIIVVIFVLGVVLIMWYKNKDKAPLGSGRSKAASGCCGANDLARWQVPQFEVGQYDFDIDQFEKYGDQSVAFSPGTGYDNISMPFATSKPDATPSSALGYNPAQPPALVRQKYMSSNQVRPHITENDYANYAGLA